MTLLLVLHMNSSIYSVNICIFNDNKFALAEMNPGYDDMPPGTPGSMHPLTPGGMHPGTPGGMHPGTPGTMPPNTPGVMAPGNPGGMPGGGPQGGVPPNSYGGPPQQPPNGFNGPMQGPPNSFNGPGHGHHPSMGPGPPFPGMMGNRPPMQCGAPGGGKIYPPNQPMVFNPSNPNAPPIYPCGICHKEVHDNDHAILCESGCNFWFHRVCTGLTEPAYLSLTKEIYAEWVCDKCLSTKNIPVVKVKP